MAQNTASSSTAVVRLQGENERDSILLVFDGRLYFRAELKRRLGLHELEAGSIDDAHLLLRAYRRWGTGMFEHLNGSWAIALWDAAANRLLLARDRLGVKPLYYCRLPGAGFIFASELRAMAQAPGGPRQPDYWALRQYLTLQTTLGTRSWLEGVYELEPGRYLCFDGQDVATRRYWDLPALEPERARCTAGEYAGQLRECLRGIVLEQLADLEEVACYLSGGVDTSLLLALACQLGPRRVEAVTAGFPDEAFDERNWARQVATWCEVPHYEMEVDARQYLKRLRELVRVVDQPVMGPPAYSAFLVAATLRDRGQHVVLSGDGGDKLFSASPEGLLVRGRWPAVTPELLTVAFQQETASALELCESYRAYFQRAGDGRASNDMGLRAAYRWRLLSLNDQLHSALGIESRVPFADHRLWEWACRLPPEIRSSRGYDKYVERLAAEPLLPAPVVWREAKGGFENPVDGWLREPENREAVGALLLGENCTRRGIVQAAMLADLWNQHQLGASHGEALWLLMTMELWFQETLDPLY